MRLDGVVFYIFITYFLYFLFAPAEKEAVRIRSWSELNEEFTGNATTPKAGSVGAFYSFDTDVISATPITSRIPFVMRHERSEERRVGKECRL